MKLWHFQIRFRNVTDEQRDATVDAKVDGYIHPEWSLVFMLRLGLVATQMMPENTQSGKNYPGKKR